MKSEKTWDLKTNEISKKKKKKEKNENKTFSELKNFRKFQCQKMPESR